MLGPGPVGEIMLLLDGISAGDKAQARERVNPKQHTIWQHSGHVFVCKLCGKKFKTNNSIKRHKKLVCVASLATGIAFTTSPCGSRTTI